MMMIVMLILMLILIKVGIIQVPPKVLVQAATPLADSPTEEREDTLFCSFDDSPLSQVLSHSTLLVILN